VWLVMGYQKNLSVYGNSGFWPGNAAVDIIAHDPYIRAEESASLLAFRIIDRSQWFRNNAGSGRAWDSKPILIGEFGADLGGNTASYPTGDRGTLAHRADALNGITARLAEMVALNVTELNFWDAGSDFLSGGTGTTDGAAFAALKAACEAT
jgi:hypothetical protein